MESVTTSRERVCVIGLGYIGLPTAVLLAQSGKQVRGVDVNPKVVEAINSGRAHIVEPDLDGLLHHVVKEGWLTAENEAAEADVYVIAVPTPFKGSHVPDLTYVEAAADAIAPHLGAGALVILESTVPPGTTASMAQRILDARPDLTPDAEHGQRVHFAHCPERVLPGRILMELVANDRIVGGLDSDSTLAAQRFYQSFVRGECVPTNARTAELAKLSENAFRDANIAFANELSMIAARLDIDVWELIALANRHPRVNILRPGPGVGGHCIAVDPWFIVDAAPEEAQFIAAARATNLRKTQWVIDAAERAIEKAPADAPVVCLGLSYKPNIDDLRESPALVIAEILAERHPGRVVAVEPHIDALPPSAVAAGLSFSRKLDTDLLANGLIVALVPHEAFRILDFDGYGDRLIDACGIGDF